MGTKKETTEERLQSLQLGYWSNQRRESQATSPWSVTTEFAISGLSIVYRCLCTRSGIMAKKPQKRSGKQWEIHRLILQWHPAARNLWQSEESGSTWRSRAQTLSSRYARRPRFCGRISRDPRLDTPSDQWSLSASGPLVYLYRCINFNQTFIIKFNQNAGHKCAFFIIYKSTNYKV